MSAPAPGPDPERDGDPDAQAASGWAAWLVALVGIVSLVVVVVGDRDDVPPAALPPLPAVDAPALDPDTVVPVEVAVGERLRIPLPGPPAGYALVFEPGGDESALALESLPGQEPVVVARRLGSGVIEVLKEPDCPAGPGAGGSPTGTAGTAGTAGTCTAQRTHVGALRVNVAVDTD